MNRVVTYIFLLTIMLPAAPVWGQGLSVATLALPPYGYVDRGKPMGIAYEWGNAIAKEAGYEPKNMLVQLARGVLDIKTGNANLIIMLPNPSVDKVAEPIGSVAPTENVILGRTGTVLRSLKDVKGKVVARVRGAKYTKRIGLEDGVIVHSTDSYEQSLKLLMAKRVDFVVGPKSGLFFTAKKMRLPAQALGKPYVLSSVSSVLYLSKETATPEMKRRLSEALFRLKHDGTISSIIEKYSL